MKRPPESVGGVSPKSITGVSTTNVVPQKKKAGVIVVIKSVHDPHITQPKNKMVG